MRNKNLKRSGGTPKPRSRALPGTGPGAGKVGILVGGRIKYVDRPGARAEQIVVKPARPKAQKPPKSKIDPKYLAAARELRDRYLERVNNSLVLTAPAGKYDVSRAIPAPSTPVPLIAAA